MSAGPLALCRLRVSRVTDLTLRVRRLTLAGPDLARFAVPPQAFGPYFKLVLPPAGVADEAEVGWPAAGADGRLVWPATRRRAVLRTYSVRQIDRASGTLTFDVVLHARGPGSDWARRAVVGGEVLVWGPGVSVPPPSDHVLLCGDHTALPAIAFILENLSPAATGCAIVEVPAREEVQALRCPPGIRLIWLHRGGDADRSGLLERLRRESRSIGAETFFFAGAEASIARAIRLHARGALGLPADRVNVLNYWKHDRAEGGFSYVED